MLRNTKIISSKKNFYSNKNIRSYPKFLSNEISLLSFDKKNTKLIGSASYKSQKYPSDIDLSENVVTCCSKKEAVDFFYHGIRKIVQNIVNEPNHWFIELKCGVDDRYNLDLINNIHLWLSKNKNMMNHDDIVELHQLMRAKNKKLANEIIKSIFRKYYVIRWTSDQVMFGSQVRANKIFNLIDCIDISFINIEVIAIIENKFTDISNFFILSYHDLLTGENVLVNFERDFFIPMTQKLKNGLCDSINELYCSETKRNLFKVVKRLFSLIRIYNEKQLYKLILPIIESDLSAMYQLKSELDTLYEIANFTDNFPLDIYMDQLESIRWRFGANMYSSNEFPYRDIETNQDTTFENYFYDKITYVIDNPKDIFSNLHILKNLSGLLLTHLNNILDIVFENEGIIDLFKIGSHNCFNC